MGIAKIIRYLIGLNARGVYFIQPYKEFKTTHKSTEERPKLVWNYSSYKTWGWNQLKQLATDPYYAGQIETRIKELDLKASNIHREKASQNQVWDEEVNKLEMESERLKEIILEAKKPLINPDLVKVADAMALTLKRAKKITIG